MIVLGYRSSKKNQEVEATSVSGQLTMTSAGKKQSKKSRRETLQALTQRDLSYFSSEKFAASLKKIEDKVLKHQWSDIIEDRRDEARWQYGQTMKPILKEQARLLIFGDMLNYHFDPLEHWGRGAVKNLLRGYRSQALTNAKRAKGWNKKFYFILADLLINEDVVNEFFSKVNAPVIREHLRF